MAKPWWKSKVIGFNAVAAALIALESNYSLLQPYLPISVYLVGAMVIAGVNAGLRIITSQGISLGRGGDHE